MELQDITNDKLQAIYQKLFSLHYLNCNLGDKLGVIALTCRITNALRQKNPKITCYDVLLKIGKDFAEVEKNIKSAAARDRTTPNEPEGQRNEAVYCDRPGR